MKMLPVHRTPASDALPFKLSDLKDHIGILHDEDDASIARIGLTTAAAIEQFAQIAFLTQTIRLTIFAPGWGQHGLSLPVGPVCDDATPRVIIDGQPFTAFDFVRGDRPYIRWLADYFDLMPTRITVEYQAGYGADASAIPPDLSQALIDQVALQYASRFTSPCTAPIAPQCRGVQP